MSRDIVLITIDCWRHDAPSEMDEFASLTENYLHRESICPAPATRGVFPAILSGQYYPTVYSGFDSIRDGTTPLVELLSDEGYATGGFVASNPFLSAWRPYFDTFWNDGLGTGSTRETTRLSDVYDTIDNVTDYLRFRGRVTTKEMSKRASEWYSETAGRKFLWLHLMDVHVPFLPGFRRSFENGLVKTLYSHYKYSKNHSDIDTETVATLERLYWDCVEFVDEQIGNIFELIEPDDIVVIVGDHGEEFEHGKYGHARLYDECVRVPLFVSPGAADWFSGSKYVRQLDIPATIASNLDIEIPTNWEGSPHGPDARPSFLLNHSPMLNRVYTGVRTEERKLIRTFDAETKRRLRTEAYDLAGDPDETTDVSESAEWVGQLEAELDEFVSRDEIGENILEDGTQLHDSTVEKRLRTLGYK
ncbi:sulfatase-like hydrolase/transferase [Haladaptatus caseinilyticus]|uniref:sulfatase-like hydrolase/transferase n=1 Tax=Haladaptatus caseinilyticus TaxID=2993314 RepID=UPI00224B0E2B|nr:sulfatase-like hydrolase/transferase [Haladaptatus caseinilyticus]